MASVSRTVLDGLIFDIELLFPFATRLRMGFRVRGVSKEWAQRMEGHSGIVTKVCFLLNTELQLGMNEAMVAKLGEFHDLYKALSEDKPRVEVGNVDLPLSVLAAKIARVIKSGQSKKARREELERALPLLEEHLSRDAPRSREEILDLTRLYFLREGRFSKEALFVHDMGQVIDAHCALWYIAEGHMPNTVYNVRSFTYLLITRIRSGSARAYWRRVKERYLALMLPAYRNRNSMVRAQ